jgi:HAD superfamily hydrolase (TIGR01490 family)
MKKKRVAVFDIDGTIFRSSLLIEVMEAMIEAGLFPVSAARVYAKAHRAWLDRKGTYDEYIMAVVAAFKKHIRGIHFKDFVRVTNKIVRLRKDRVYRYTRDLTRTLKSRGYFLLAISLSPKGAVDSFAKNLGFDKIYALRYEMNEKTGRYTGGYMDFEMIRDKGRIVRRAVEKEGLTLRGSVGVGDTEGDITFLKLVESPICFNPNSHLYAHAKKKGWKVIVERKDVIYEL